LERQKHLIIGCGSAGMSALKQLRKLNSSEDITLVSMETCRPYSPMSLPYVLSGRRRIEDIYTADAKYFDAMRAKLVLGKKMEGIDTKNQRVIYSDRETEAYDSLLIATGSEPSLQSLLAESNIPGFHILADCLPLLDLNGSKRVAVLGAGFVGMEVAAALCESGHEVSVIAPRERILRLYFDPEMDDYIVDLFGRHGIRVSTGWGEVAETHEEDGAYRLNFESGKEVVADRVIAATGVKPRISFLDGSGILVNKGIVVDRKMRTSVPNVFAAGDVAESPDLLTGKYGLSLILPSAVEQGKVAAMSMAGREASYEGWLSVNSFNFFGQMAVSLGDFMGSDGARALVKRGRERGAYTKLVFTDDRLVGANFFNVKVDSGVIRYLIRNRVAVGKHKDLLLEKPREAGQWLMLMAERANTTSLEQ
jgi:phenylglyoxylate dehydrogenase epsilon subunit